MKVFTQEQFYAIIQQQSRIRPRLRRELRYVASTAAMTDSDWRELELLPITDRTGNKGVLFLQPDDTLYVLPYEMRRGFTSAKTGRAQPIICDFCRTWQAGSSAGSIGFQKDKQSLNSVSFLCCADLACSKHVRGKTNAALASKAQLREDLTAEQRVERLKTQLRKIIVDLKLEPISFL